MRARVAAAFAAAFDAAALDVLASPTSPTVAYPLGEAARRGVGAFADDAYTAPASLAGLPALSVPWAVGGGGHLPVGAQFVARADDERALLRVGLAFERAQQRARGDLD